MISKKSSTGLRSTLRAFLLIRCGAGVDQELSLHWKHFLYYLSENQADEKLWNQIVRHEIYIWPASFLM